jgi:hypothetical protein
VQAEDKKLIDELVQNACFAADRVALTQSFGSPAEATRVKIHAALELLIGNGLIVVKPLEEWPLYIALDPPYNTRER